jgi:hypothetical protein
MSLICRVRVEELGFVVDVVDVVLVAPGGGCYVLTHAGLFSKACSIRRPKPSNIARKSGCA